MKKDNEQNRRLLLFGYLVSSLGDKIYLVSLTLFLIKEFKKPDILAQIIAISSLPQLFFGFFAGQIVDKLNKKKIIVLSDLLRGILMLSIVFFLKTEHLHVSALAIITFFISGIGVFFDPAIASFIPLICTGENELKKINSALYAFINISTVLGPVLGAFLFGTFSFKAVVILNAISYALSGFSEILIKDLEPPKKCKPSDIDLSEELSQGMALIFRHRALKRVVFLSLVTNLFFIPFFELFLPIIVTLELHYNDLFFGSISTARAIGTITGSLLIYKWVIKHLEKFYAKTLFIQGLVVFTTGVTVFFQDQTMYVTLCLYITIFIAGNIGALSNIPLNVLIQQNAPKDRVATTFSTMSTLFRVLAPITLFFFGRLTKYISSSTLSVVSGLIVMFITVLIFFLPSAYLQRE